MTLPFLSYVKFGQIKFSVTAFPYLQHEDDRHVAGLLGD